MFTRLLYFDKERVIEYNAIISKDDFVEFDEVDILDSTEGFAGIANLKGSKEVQKSKHGKVQAAASRVWNTFSENLKKSEWYVDLLDSNKSIEAIGRGCILRVESDVQIPEEFDTISLLNSVPQNILENQLVSEIDEDEKDIVKAFFKMKKAALPIMFDFEGKLFCSKLKTDCFLCTDQEFEDCIEEDLVIVAKVLSPNRSSKKELFNPLKDFFMLNRAARRAMETDNIEGLENIYAEKDYVHIEILAIYQ